MYYEKNSRAFNLIVGLALGAVMGAMIAYLAPARSRRRVRRRLAKAVSGAKGSSKLRWDAISVDLRGALGSGRRLLQR